MERYKKIVDELIKKSFLKLRNEKIRIIEYPNWLFWWISGFVYKLPFSWGIFINNKVRELNRKALVGLLTHELCHVEQDKKIIKNFLFGFFQSFFVGLNWALDTQISRDIERKTDLLTIKKGYGRELLTLRLLSKKKHSKKKLAKSYSRGYLIPQEIKSYMKKYRK